MRIAVIGAGVIGLTTSIELLRAGHQVVIYTRERPEDTTSAVPAAIWFPYHAEPKEDVHRWALATLERLRELANDPQTGVRWVDFARTWRDKAPPVESWATNLRWLGERAYSISVPLMENPTYMRWLARRFHEAGGELVHRELNAIEELEEDTIVNCSGYGARALCGDQEVTPGRGVVVLVEKLDEDRHVLNDEGELMYIISRANDCVLGGCDEPSDIRAVSMAEADVIIGRSGVKGTINSVDVGIRPIREAGVRLELQRLQGRRVIHNYGHGGAGFTLSWGCAADVKHLVG